MVLCVLFCFSLQYVDWGIFCSFDASDSERAIKIVRVQKMSESGLFCGEFVPISHPLLATIHPHCPPNIQLNTFAKVWISCLVCEQLPAMAREEEEEMDKGEEEGIIRFDSTGWAEHPPAVNKIKDNIFNCKYLLVISKNIFLIISKNIFRKLIGCTLCFWCRSIGYWLSCDVGGLASVSIQFKQLCCT